MKLPMPSPLLPLSDNNTIASKPYNMHYTCTLIPSHIQYKAWLHFLVLYSHTYMSCCCHLTAAFNVSLELQRHCTDQLTLICRHSDILTDPNWIHNGTVEGGQLLATAFPGAMYSVQSNTEHRVTISGVGNVQALDGYIIQSVYSIQGNLIKSNAVKYSFIPPGQCMCCIQGMSFMSPMCPHEQAQYTCMCTAIHV